MPEYGLTSPARLKAAQARCRGRQQALQQLASARSRRLLLKALASQFQELLFIVAMG